MKKISLALLIGVIAIIAGFAQHVEPFPDYYLGKSQDYTQDGDTKAFLPEPVKIIGIYTASIVLNTIGDGLNDSGKKQWGHLCNAANIGLLLSSPFVIKYDKSKWGWYLASYVALRIAVFDYTYNSTRGLPLNYIGGSSTWDKALQEIKPPETSFARAIFFTLGVAIPINELGKHSKSRIYY